MVEIAWIVGILLAVIAVTLLAARVTLERRAVRIGRRLARPGATVPFEPSMLDGLPEPARRYLAKAIQPGTPLAHSVRLVLGGAPRISRDGEPAPMRSKEILAPPRGYLWRASVRSGVMAMRGYDLYVDGDGEMRWWLWGVVPVVRASGRALGRSAVGRLVGEGVLMPSALLPLRGALWEPVDENTARVRQTVDGEEVVMDIHVEPDGRMGRVSIRRWNNDPANGPVGYQPFVIDAFSEERTFEGYTIPTRFRAGWRLGAADEYPFFFAAVEVAEYRS